MKDEEQEFPRNKRRKKKRKKKHYLLKFTLFVAFCMGMYFFLTSNLFDIQQIKVADNAYYTPEQIISMSKVKIGDNLFETKMTKVKKRLLADPYIKNVKISRGLPGTIEIAVQERVECAAIPYGERYILIDKEGLVLRKTEVAPTLPLLMGMTLKSYEAGNPLQVEENYVLTDTLKMLELMDEAEIYFKKIDISEVVIKAYIYDSLYCEGTPENIMNGMDNLKQVLLDLYEKGIERGVIKVGSDHYYSFNPTL